MFTVALFFYFLIGMVAGILGGLLGIGGGLITVPALLFVFHFLQISSPYLMQMAIGTSLSAMVFTAASSAWCHFKTQNVAWKILYIFIPNTIIGAIVGAITANHLSGYVLKVIFATSLFFIGLYLLFSPLLKEQKKEINISYWLANGVGFMIGMISSILGIGGGIITVPLLTFFGISIRQAISTSAILSFVIACTGSLFFIYEGLFLSTLNNSIGFVYIPAFLVIGFTSACFAPIGAKLAYQLSTTILQKVLGFILFIISITFF